MSFTATAEKLDGKMTTAKSNLFGQQKLLITTLEHDSDFPMVMTQGCHERL